ncbi:MAG: DUF4390 domain-containing protein [Acidobacteriota bacterium]
MPRREAGCASLPAPGGRQRRPRLPVVLLALLGATTLLPAREGDDPRILDLQAAESDGSWTVSLRVENAFSEKIDDELRSGLPVTFRYVVEIYRKKGWIRSRVLTRELEVTADFDSLTRQYRLTREVDDDVVASSATEKEEEMRRWMTRVEGLDMGALPSDLPEGPLFVRAKCRLSSGFVGFFFPYSQETGWERIPLPVPGRTGDPG